MALGNEVQVTSTPTLFINGRRIANIGGMPYEALKRMVEFLGSMAK
jgi:protein-disulfide isomerase